MSLIVLNVDFKKFGLLAKNFMEVEQPMLPTSAGNGIMAFNAANASLPVKDFIAAVNASNLDAEDGMWAIALGMRQALSQSGSFANLVKNYASDTVSLFFSFLSLLFLSQSPSHSLPLSLSPSLSTLPGAV